jgi:hypothetical protein
MDISRLQSFAKDEALLLAQLFAPAGVSNASSRDSYRDCTAFCESLRAYLARMLGCPAVTRALQARNKVHCTVICRSLSAGCTRQARNLRCPLILRGPAAVGQATERPSMRSRARSRASSFVKVPVLVL